jgi:cohesin complex subunit SA-1/2
VVVEWLQSYKANNVIAVCEVVNFVLKCAGGELSVDVHDIEDVDNVTGRLGDLQDEYQAQKITDYPLMSRNKQYVGFRDGLTKFFVCLVATLHSSNTLYSDSALIENIQTWVSTMSSAPIRPFRHTATVISLAIMDALCDVAEDLQSLQSTAEQQVEKEKNQKRVNKDRVTSMTKNVQEYKEKLGTVDAVLKDSFDTVFVHRYRDVDPKIRSECVTGLGYWISTYQSMFFEGQYLRYLGWVLSDTVSHTRAEVVKQLRVLFGPKRNVPRLRAFTDRFRPRMVEMAAKDADPSVRASAVELLDLIRDHGLLEPDDIDTIGQLIFDAEPRVRKAVARYFVANITDVYDASLEDVLHGEKIEEYLSNEEDDEFESPKRAWIKFKCLAGVLQQYDSEDGEEQSDQVERGPPGSRDILIATRIDSRFSLASQAIYSHLPEIQHWEWLAGYLLFDHSLIPDAPDQDDIAAQLKALYRLEEGQDTILLEVLVSAVKLRSVQVAELEKDKSKKSKGKKGDATVETPETLARNLMNIIPLLLSKFGAVPTAASAVLRLEHFLNLDIVEDLQEEPAGYSSLLDKINEQFLGHSDENVLAEASGALLRAKGHPELNEIAQGKLAELWNDIISSLRAPLKGMKDLESTETLPHGSVQELVGAVSRILTLARISDPSEELSKLPVPTKSPKQKSHSPKLSVLDILLQLASRASQRTLTTSAADDDGFLLEDSLTIQTMRTLLYQLMWSITSIEETIKTGADLSPASTSITFLSNLTDRFLVLLTAVLKSRSGFDPVRHKAATMLMDAHAALARLRDTRPAKSITPTNFDAVISLLVKDVSPENQALVMTVFLAAEKNFANKSHRTLEPADDDPPEELGAPEDEDEEADEDDRMALLAEESLCLLTGRIVSGIIGRTIDSSGPGKGKLRQRILRNKTKLGPNFKEVLNYLDLPKDKRKVKAKDKVKSKGKEAEKKSEALLLDDDDIEDEEAVEGQREEEDEDEDLRRRGLAEDANEEQRDEGGGEEEGGEDEEDEVMGD